MYLYFSGGDRSYEAYIYGILSNKGSEQQKKRLFHKQINKETFFLIIEHINNYFNRRRIYIFICERV